MDAEPIDESICGVGTIMEDGIAIGFFASNYSHT